MQQKKEFILNNNLKPKYIENNVLPLFNIKNAKVTTIKFKDTDKQRAVYKIENTNDNIILCLKKVYYNFDDLLFIYSAMEWLFKNNINVPRFLPSIDNNRFVLSDHMLFVLTPWIDGTKCDFDNNTHVKKSITTLGKIHSCSINFRPINSFYNRTSSNNIYISTVKHFNDLLYASNCAHKHNDTFSYNFLLNFDKNLSLAKLSLYFASKINNNHLSKSLCHCDFVNKNIILSKSNSVWIIDFDKCKYDLCARDLSYFIRRILKRKSTEWKIDVAIPIIENYIKQKELTTSDIYYILSYISFPQKYWKISKDYYTNKPKCDRNRLSDIILEENRKADTHYKFMLDFINYLNDRFNKDFLNK